MTNLLWYTEDPKVPPLLTAALGRQYRIRFEANRLRFLSLAAQRQADVLVVDLDSCEDAAEVMSFFEKAAASGIPTIAMTDDDRRSTALELLQRGAFDYFRKPPSLVELGVVLRRACDHTLLKKELEDARARLGAVSGCDRLLGTSGRAQVVYDLIHRVADLNAFVLIRGESGTGKELVARAIHNLSGRAKEPFVAIACGAFPETLIEAELFGHEKGAFTGTTGARMGYMEQAGEGTLLLDEIGELSLPMQVKLLRVLQQREFSRLGSNRLVPLKARVLFATHRDLGAMVQEGTFRRDLYYRLNVIEINVPALRDRTEDIPLLANHFLRRYAEEFGKPVTEIRPSAMEMLVDYEWPGNIRELENCIQSAVILSEDEAIQPEHLPPALQTTMETTSTFTASGNTFEDQLNEYRIAIASKALAEYNGNKTLAARSLNISRSYLHRLIRREANEDVASAI